MDGCEVRPACLSDRFGNWNWREETYQLGDFNPRRCFVLGSWILVDFGPYVNRIVPIQGSRVSRMIRNWQPRSALEMYRALMR